MIEGKCVMREQKRKSSRKSVFADLGVDRLIHHGHHYDAINTFDDDFPFYLKWCRRVKGRVLELCCGTGRLSIPLAKKGIEIEGLDFSEDMLRYARKKAADAQVGIPWHKGDMCKFSLRKKFALIFIPFNSLQNTYRFEDVEKIFECVKKHLGPRGLFIFDVFNPSIHLMVDRERRPVEQYKGTRLADGSSFMIHEQCAYDAATQCNRVTWTYVVNGKKSKQKLDMRCFYPQELDILLKYNGFKVLHKFGDFEGKEFASGSTKQIFVCQKR